MKLDKTLITPLIEILEELNSGPATESMLTFLKSYNGEVTEELIAMITDYISMVVEGQRMAIDANSYLEMKEVMLELKNTENELKRQYKALENNDLTPFDVPIPTDLNISADSQQQE